MVPTKRVLKAMIDADVSQAEIARQLGITPPAVCSAIHGRTRSQRIRRAIADAVNKPYSWLWGEEDPEAAPGAAPDVHTCTSTQSTTGGR